MVPRFSIYNVFGEQPASPLAGPRQVYVTAGAPCAPGGGRAGRAHHTHLISNPLLPAAMKKEMDDTKWGDTLAARLKDW